MKDMMIGVGKPKVSVDIPFKITRDTNRKQIVTKQQSKVYRVVYNMHVIIDHFETLPYGF